MRRRVTAVLGALVSFAGLAAVVEILVDRRGAVADLLVVADPAALGAALASTALGMLVVAGAWSAAAAVVHVQVPRRTVVPTFFRGEIGKYLPGAIWATVGRAELLVRQGVGRVAAYRSVVVSLVGFYLAAALLGGTALLASGQPVPGGLALAASAAVFLLAHPRAHRLAESVARSRRLPVPPSPTALALLALRYLPAWLLLGTATWLCGRALGHHDLGLARAVGATAVAWLVGFAVVPAPGGLGVREAALVALLGLPPADAAAVALTARLLCIAVDTAGALAATALQRPRGRTRQAPTQHWSS